MDPLPSLRQLLSTLIPSIAQTTNSSDQPQTSNPLKDAPPAIQQALLTLHVLFPNELLPALDLLDRNLITHLSIESEALQYPQGSQPEQHQQLQAAPPIQDLQHAAASQLQRPEQSARISNYLVRNPRRSGELAVLDDQLPREQPAREPDASHEASARGHHSYSARHQVPSSLSAADAHRTPHQSREVTIPTPLPTRQLEPQPPRPASYAFRPTASTSHHDRIRRMSSVWRCSSSRTQSHLRPGTVSYEVRLDAWNCSCPAFAFAAFPARAPQPHHHQELISPHWTFGGLTLGGDVPICKHLLACALVEHSELFSGLVQHQTVSMEEFAGWAAGWGD
jgi:hypothetical protein